MNLSKKVVLNLMLLMYHAGKLSGKYRGIGRLQRLLKHDFIFEAFGKKFFFNHNINGSYDLLLIGISNEPETPILLEKIFSQLKSASFIDIGASIGEMVIFSSKFDSVKQIYALEPRPNVALALRKTVELNHEHRIEIIEKAAGNVHGERVTFFGGRGTASSMVRAGKVDECYEVECVRMDEILPEELPAPVVLIDVEGAELMVMKGMPDFIRNNQPLIMFEHHEKTKKVFSLDDVQKLLPSNYRFWRIKSNGRLDKQFDLSWNIMAVPAGSIFEDIIREQIDENCACS